MGFFARFLGPRVPQISINEAYARIQGGDPPLLLDVRQPAELQAVAIPGAINIPLTQLGQRLAELPPHRPILTICRSAHRSPIAARRLARAGYTVTDVAGGVQAWQAAGLPTTR